MTNTNDTILELLAKANAYVDSVVINLREVYGLSAPILNLLIERELEAAVHLKQHIHSILEGAKLEKTLNQ